MFQKCSGIRIFLDSRGITFLSIFFSHIAKIIVGEPSCVSELFYYQNFLDNRVITILSVVFVSQCRKFCGETLNVLDKLGHPTILCIMGEFHDFPSKIFSLAVPKNFVGENFCVSEMLCYQFFLDKMGITIRSIFFVSQCPNIFWRNLQCSTKFMVWKRLTIREAGILFFFRNF